MKKHSLVIQKADVFCELCYEFHSLINCPNCGLEMWCIGFHEGRIVECSGCEREFAVWQFGDTSTVIVECEHLWRLTYNRAECGEPSATESCCEAACPLKGARP